ncbi:hypothetical protein Bbelb_390070 [Branchiostoma belcheri]|nr:hypothetical protein Bbelb_390070 [Branchiostoma belcheri]
MANSHMKTWNDVTETGLSSNAGETNIPEIRAETQTHAHIGPPVCENSFRTFTHVIPGYTCGHTKKNAMSQLLGTTNRQYSAEPDNHALINTAARQAERGSWKVTAPTVVHSLTGDAERVPVGGYQLGEPQSRLMKERIHFVRLSHR